MGERRGTYSVMVGRPDGKRPLGRSWHRYEYNIKMNLQRVAWGSMDWTDRLGWGACECGNEASGSIILGKFLD
jgi:hypothetical protein